MSDRWLCPALAAIGLLTPSVGLWADERPLTMPTRDVDVTYESPTPGPNGQVQQMSQRMRWDTGAGQMRIDTPSPGIYTIMDYHAHRLLVVREADRSVIVMHAAGADSAPGVSRDAQFARAGEDRVAGLPCTDWRTQDSAGRPSTLCLTADGVLLRIKSGDTLLAQATRVAYGPIDPGLFTPPSGFHAVTAPP